MEFPQDFTARERALLGARFDELYAYATPQPARGVTVNGALHAGMVRAACGL